MTLKQLEYIVAIDRFRHFVTASEESAVTQATLSMMVKKLEEELTIKIFDRSRQPVVPTEVGQKIIAQAKVVIQEVRRIREIVTDEQLELQGELKIGVIPTLSPYLLPLFLPSFLAKYPAVKVQVNELSTEEILFRIRHHQLDVGLLSTPLHNVEFNEQTLFYEEFVVYASGQDKLLKKKFILADEIDVNRLWLLEEGHCLRSQVVNLCELKVKEKEAHQLDFSVGSIETLKKLVETTGGITILPRLAANDLSQEQMKNTRPFRSPVPVREIGLVTYRHYIKAKLTEALKEEILASIPNEMKERGNKTVTEINLP